MREQQNRLTVRAQILWWKSQMSIKDISTDN